FFRPWTKLDFFDLLLMLVLLGQRSLLLLLEQVLAVIHDPADRRSGFSGNFYQVQLGLFGHTQRFINRDDANLLTIHPNKANLAGRDVLIDRGLGRSSSILSHFTLNNDYSSSWRPRRETACASNCTKSSTGMEPRSTPSRVRTATEPVSTSLSPITRR